MWNFEDNFISLWLKQYKMMVMNYKKMLRRNAQHVLLTGIFLCLVASSAKATVVKPTCMGGLETQGAEMQIVAYAEGWQGMGVRGFWDKLDEEVRKFQIVQDNVCYFEGESLWKEEGQTAVGLIEMVCTKNIAMQSLSFALHIPFAENKGQLWTYDKMEQKIPTGKNLSGQLKTCTVPLPKGKILTVEFDEPTNYTEQDLSQWGNNWALRFGPYQNLRTFEKGEKVVFHCRISSSDGLEMKNFNENLTIQESPQWVKLRNYKDVESGSALDFSKQGLQKGPAGRYGWLKAKEGRFEFEKLPGKEQRFYGVNLCFSACYPTHEEADILTDRLIRLGYNTIRIHHHDDIWGKGDPEMLDRLDYLLAQAMKKGLYITTDMYVSRGVSWKSLGIEREGEMEKDLFKTLVACFEPAFQNWCNFSKTFLEHRNPYTGRMYKDEPGMPLLSLVNEGELFMSFNQKAHDPIVLQAYKEFAGNDEKLEYGKGKFNDFSLYLEKRIAQKCTTFLREIGCKALLTNDNNGSQHGEGEAATPFYDYVDNHFYIDHPAFLAKNWNLPSQCDNTNPVAYGGPGMFKKGYAKGFSKPYTITEWNFSGPGKYRGLGGILTGAQAAIQDWDGLWRFAYSHSRETLMDNPNHAPNYFDVATDPLSQASDRASICLFLRRDAVNEKELQMEEKNGVLLLATGRTCGIFAPEGKHVAGALSADISGAPGTVCLSSLDGKNIPDSKHLLLSHITDVQGEGTRYADLDKKILLKWGTGTLLEKGEAKISISLKKARRLKVYELDTAGRRVGRIPCQYTEEGLSFVVSTNNAEGQGRIYYEIARK